MTAGPALLALAFASGAALAAVYLALLWAGVRALTGQAAPARFALLAALRAALILGAVWGALSLGAGAAGLGAGLAGFVAVRLLATRRLRRQTGKDAGWR